MVEEELPDWLQVLSSKLMEQHIITRPLNHALINEYEPGQGIMVSPSCICHYCSSFSQPQPHEDGPLYLPHVVILRYTVSDMQAATLVNSSPCRSLQGGTVINIYTKRDRQIVFSLYLEPGSLFVFRDDVYTDYLHGIEEREEDSITDTVVNQCPERGIHTGATITRTATRISLTLRVVKKVYKRDRSG